MTPIANQALTTELRGGGAGETAKRVRTSTRGKGGINFVKLRVVG